MCYVGSAAELACRAAKEARILECWICEKGTRKSAPELGVCGDCSIFACDEHGDRQTKGRWLCFLCLSRMALTTAGLPGAKEDELSESERDVLMSLVEEVSNERELVERLRRRLAESVRDKKALVLGVRITARCVDLPARHVRQRRDIPIDPRLAEHWRV